MTKIFLRLVCLFSFFALTATARTPIETFIYYAKQSHDFVPVNNIWQIDNDLDKTVLLQALSKVQTLRMDAAQLSAFMKQDNFGIELNIPNGSGGNYTLELAKYDFRSDGFVVHVDGGNGQGREFNYLPGLYYRGVVKDIPGSIAAFSFFNDEVYGLFSIPGVGNFIIGKGKNTNDYTPDYILYNSNDLLHPEAAPKCGTDDLPGNAFSQMARTTTKVNEKVYNSCKQVKIFEVADYFTFQAKSTVTNTVKYITALFNCQSLIYKNEGIFISLKYLQVDSVVDYYHSLTSDAGVWLNSFGSHTKNVMHGADLAVLISAQPSAYMGGIAWLDRLCSTWSTDNSGPYCFCNTNGAVSPANPLSPPTLTYYWDVNVTTHEMGHLLGSPHTHGCYWSPGGSAIDGCYTLEGSCAMPVPQYPTGGGTIMSYCHLVSGVGVNFTNGFGPQPGAAIRSTVSSKKCDTPLYQPNTPSVTVNKTFTANAECTDPSGVTYYWYDSNTAAQTDDKLILMIKKNGNNIGTLDTSGVTISQSVLTGYKSGSGVSTSFPHGTAGVRTQNTSMNRYWSIAVKKEPVSAVEVIFPFTFNDTADINGTIPGSFDMSNLLFYKVNTPINPNPSASFPGAASSDFFTYPFGPSSDPGAWYIEQKQNTLLAHMKMTKLSGGGSCFYTYGDLSVENANGSSAGITIYPNPMSSQLFISLSNNKNAVVELYAADGKLVHTQSLSQGSNTINVSSLSAGIYFYRIINDNDSYTGKLQKH